jgi:hypothetical protein
MGKRKIGDYEYWQCDYTGFPMKNSNCYMPSYSKNGKLVKQGSYCCWEAVIAASNGDTNVQEYVNEIVGCTVAPAPNQSSLAWLNDSGPLMSIDEFLAACDDPNKPISVLEISVDGRLTEAVMNRRAFLGFSHRFTTLRKKVKDKAYEVAFNGVGLPNATATQFFKQELSGNVYVALKSRELAIQDRARYLPVDIESFTANFQTNRKRKVEVFDEDEFAKVKKQMTKELMVVENASSAETMTPMDLAKASVMPSASGREIANLVRMQSDAEVLPPRLVRQNAVPVH